MVSSREVSERFGKRHADVLESIENITTENSVLMDLYFIPSSYKAGTGKNYKEYLMTRDGFTLLAMGFTGQEALKWKLKYIEAFNKMEQQLKASMTMEDIIIYQMEQTKVFKLYLAKFSFKSICINFFTTNLYNCTLLIKNTVETKIER